jgi:uncharacterized protein (UPF0332 family)
VHVAQEVEKGTNSLRAGEELLALGLFDDAVTRFYYAAFHFASAALLTEGIEATSHSGLLTLFAEHLVRTGKLPAKRAKELKQLQAFRNAADYDRAFAFTREGAEEEAGVARGCVAELRAFLASRGYP